MQSRRIIPCIFGILGVCALAQPAQTPAERKRIVIAASTVLDGRGRVLRDTRIVIEGAKIVAIDPRAGPVDYDLRGLTVLPGWIDAHVHITWGFGKDGKNAGFGGTTQETAYEAASNAWVTLMAGFTTVQSVGSPLDVPCAMPSREACSPARASSRPSKHFRGEARRRGRRRRSARSCASKRTQVRT